jgi:PAS domain S-box-containing protein
MRRLRLEGTTILALMSNPHRESEQDRLILALSSAGMGTWEWDMSADSMWWDERMNALFGLAPGAFKGSYEDFVGLIHEEDRERIRNEFTRVIADRAAMDTEFQVAWPSHGSKHVVRMRSRVHCDDNTEISRIAGVAWDITEGRQTDLALDKERSLLMTLMDNLPWMYIILGAQQRPLYPRPVWWVRKARAE